ncbi:MAG: SMC family ATPase, partial [Oscillospiraceae bacterium]|nr:SMC family ATPase [Oscillospiraceae bacterium]
MRPTKLTMKAFGSFARETAIDFDRFKSGLYLIVGDTGAGKTTIFDAISFALFGAASGTGRRPDMMHSDYVEKSQDTLVCLSFTHTGREYTVRRSIHFSKKRGEDQYGDGKLDAELISPEGPVIKGHVAVTRRCEELLGLNADQFRKIVMLAQGEFKEFLTADAARKSDILSRLFDSSLYVRYQKLLDAARDSLAQRRRGYTESLNRAMGDFLPPSDDPEENIKYLPGNPELTANLHRLLEEDRAALAELDGEKLRAQKAVEELNRRKGAAIGDNALISELAEKEVQQRELLERQAEMELLRAQCDRAD